MLCCWWSARVFLALQAVSCLVIQDPRGKLISYHSKIWGPLHHINKGPYRPILSFSPTTLKFPRLNRTVSLRPRLWVVETTHGLGTLETCLLEAWANSLRFSTHAKVPHRENDYGTTAKWKRATVWELTHISSAFPVRSRECPVVRSFIRCSRPSLCLKKTLPSEEIFMADARSHWAGSFL